jgi:hypothetical protein
MISWVASRFGERALRELCEEVARTHDVERSLRRSTRMGSADLEAGFVGGL